MGDLSSSDSACTASPFVLCSALHACSSQACTAPCLHACNAAPCVHCMLYCCDAMSSCSVPAIMHLQRLGRLRLGKREAVAWSSASWEARGWSILAVLGLILCAIGQPLETILCDISGSNINAVHSLFAGCDIMFLGAPVLQST
eukprot:1160918-Pelagomonas_calceolata.AAC.4